MKIAFMGSDPIALPLLRYLHEARPAGVILDSIFTQPDRPTGRGMQVRPNAIKQWATEHGYSVHQPAKCGQAEADYFNRAAVHMVLVMAYGQILPRSLLAAVPGGFLNLHASLLPRLRGASPIHTAVALGLARTGVSLMRIIPQLDAGPVADSEPVAIAPDDTGLSVHDKLADACVPLLARALPAAVAGSLRFNEQDVSQVTYCRIIEKTDAHLDFNRPAVELANRIRAFQPWPGSSFPCRDVEVRVLQAEPIASGPVSGQPGSFHIDPESGPVISCGEGALRLLRLQRPGGKPLDAEDFLRGFAIADGSMIESRPMRPLEAPAPFPYKRK